jgi:hypothetical protein
MLGLMGAKDCICFPPNDPPHLELKAEIEAAGGVLCPLHGERFSKLAPSIYRVVNLLCHLDQVWRSWHSPQYTKAMDASFPPDRRWRARRVEEPDGAVRFVQKERNRNSSHRPQYTPHPAIIDKGTQWYRTAARYLGLMKETQVADHGARQDGPS